MGKYKEFDIFERYAVSQIACRSSGPEFPISIKKYMRYIQYRASFPATFQRYVMGLETHRLHGPSWISRIRNCPDAMALIKKVDKRMSKLIPNYSSLLSRLGKAKEGNNVRKDETKAHAVAVENNGKKGYMVIINSDADNGSDINEDDQDSADQRNESLFPYVVTIRIKNKYLLK